LNNDNHIYPTPHIEEIAVPVEYIASSSLPLPFGKFAMHGFIDHLTGKEHIALTIGDIAGNSVMTRLHSECLTGDALFSMRCDCGYQLQEALKQIALEGRGILLYLRQEGRGIGLLNKIKAYHLQDEGADTVEANEKLGFSADQRNYNMAADMLNHLQVSSVRLLTNNPHKVEELRNYGIPVLEQLSLQVGKNIHNHDYLVTKARKMNHLLDI
jgi:GTP cyclohydrolase II